MNSETRRIKRFYKATSVAAEGNRYAVLLDDRRASTALRNVLSAPNAALAQAVADEWAAQDEHIIRTSMPLTGMLSVVIDADDAAIEEWREEIVAYLKSDLVCYRAETPTALVSRQSEEWDPFLDWLRRECAVNLKVTAGIVSVEQPDEAAQAITEMLKYEMPETIFAVKLATTLAGSAVLALALWKKAFAPQHIFEASRLDERFQEERWGVDQDAKDREEHLLTEFLAIGQFLSLL